ncbi:EpsD family peptidyl-prolyl cis-trans isomerase [Sphingobium sp. DEHP117]|uniref:EpsD family peptidyl-prolyl cis-trans isomerase n=1 Tax=Sphingobium sp. DEHP117 TaxID=2993436 RepID=UPI0027D54B8B|nr:EpsD family peptidyl-prolyl cis-trans isomerase [Sphingobium sp. DEHP117]MDQ4420025.1 EpsD family peptidyl-prolyl cis-trans isomerase [Sphingobium sp. DEHP117]
MKTLGVILLPSLALLAACGDKEAAAPTGQVAATVNGKEITVIDIRHEAGTATPSKELEEAALRSLIVRQLLADEAVEEKVDQLPATAIMQEKARQMVLVDALTNQIRSTAPKPSRDEAQQFIANHPASFDQRRIFLVDQIIIPTSTPDLVKAIEPLDTMAQIEQLLNSRKVQFQRAVGSIDALSIDADIAEKISQLPENAVFASPENGVIRINRIREAVIQPISGEAAMSVAMTQIARQRSEAIVANKIQSILDAGKAKVKYNAAYDPAAKIGAKVPAAK